MKISISRESKFTRSVEIIVLTGRIFFNLKYVIHELEDFDFWSREKKKTLLEAYNWVIPQRMNRSNFGFILFSGVSNFVDGRNGVIVICCFGFNGISILNHCDYFATNVVYKHVSLNCNEMHYLSANSYICVHCCILLVTFQVNFQNISASIWSKNIVKVIFKNLNCVQ